MKMKRTHALSGALAHSYSSAESDQSARQCKGGATKNSVRAQNGRTAINSAKTSARMHANGKREAHRTALGVILYVQLSGK
jgi:hypothetical protein